MIAVLASELDSEARSVVEEWASHGAALLSARDLTSQGWEFLTSDSAAGIAVIAGKRVPVSNLRAVLTRRPAVLAEELHWLAPSDRSYVAAETNAFLVAWLSSIPCRVVNKPTTTSLCGPAWDGLHWRSAAAIAGVKWASDDDVASVERVVVCGAECFFTSNARQESLARALARIAGVELLSVLFRGEHLCGASVAPPLDHRDLRECLVRQLLEVA